MKESTPSGILTELKAFHRQSLRGVSTLDLLHELAARFSNGEEFPASEEGIVVAKLLKDHLDVLTDVHNNRFSRKRLRDYYQAFVRPHSWNHPPLENTTWVELGSGSQNPYAFLFLILLLGADRCFAIDSDPIQEPSMAYQAICDVAATIMIDPLSILDKKIDPEIILQRMKSFDFAKLHSGNEAGLDRARLTHLCETAESLSLPDGIADVVMSNSFLEHVADPETVIREAARITKKGGVGLHGIDWTDHRRYTDPTIDTLSFLELDDPATIVEGCNRIRPQAMLDLFEKNGFEVLDFEEWNRDTLTADRIARFAEPFRSMPQQELELLNGLIYVRRKG